MICFSSLEYDRVCEDRMSSASVEINWVKCDFTKNTNSRHVMLPPLLLLFIYILWGSYVSLYCGIIHFFSFIPLLFFFFFCFCLFFHLDMFLTCSFVWNVLGFGTKILLSALYVSKVISLVLIVSLWHENTDVRNRKMCVWVFLCLVSFYLAY